MTYGSRAVAQLMLEGGRGAAARRTRPRCRDQFFDTADYYSLGVSETILAVRSNLMAFPATRW